MKKSLLFAVCLCILLGAGLAYSATVIWDQKDAVLIKHEVLEGSADAAEGIQFHIRNQWTGRLFWDTEATFDADGQIIYRTDFKDDWAIKNKSKYLSHFGYDGMEEGVSIWYNNGYHHYSGMQTTAEKLGETRDIPFIEAVIRVAERTKPGTVNQETVRIADYVERYPLVVDITGSGNLDWTYFERDFLGDYFGIQIPETEKLKVTIAKSENGAITELVLENVNSTQFVCCSVDTEEGVYFGFYCTDESSNVVNLERKRENGIYFIPMERKETEQGEWREVQYKEIGVAFTLPKAALPVELTLDEQGNLLLLTKESDGLILRRLDRASMQELQYMQVLPWPEETRFSRMEPADNGLFIAFENGDFAYLTTEGEPYQKVISGSLGSLSGLADYYHDWAYALDYKDGRLAIIGAESYYRCSSYIYVFDRDGLLYKGRISCASDAEDHYDYRGIFLQEEQPYSIAFAE